MIKRKPEEGTDDQHMTKKLGSSTDQLSVANSEGLKGNKIPLSSCNDPVKATSDVSGSHPSEVLREGDVAAKRLDILPTSVLPVHYSVFITPGLADFKFEGQVSITVIVKESTDVIEMNARDITFKEITVRSVAGGSVECTEINVIHEQERLVVKLSEYLQEGSEWVIDINYVGIHNEKMVGFYRVPVEHNGKKEYTYVTQFESNFCRRALPCWDEPSIKCKFDVKLRVPIGITALSNMDISSEQIDPASETKVVEYNTTPFMSTYLLAFVVGKYRYVEKYTTPKQIGDNISTNAIRCRVYTHEDSINRTKFALECGCLVLEFFEEYFRIPYPLTKMDQVTVHNFRSGAMENWGLVTYREAALLLDPEKSGIRAKHLVSIYIAHEFAHQWFGNFVTMKWWNDLWLNEGFATFAGTLVLDKLYPEWTPFQDFISDELYPALSLDSMNSTHPIDVPVYSPVDVTQIFDAISYSKGASVIRMIFSYLGEEKFRDGLCSYLKDNAYSNATTHDMWTALAKVSGEKVDTLMGNWVTKPGYPIVNVIEETYNEKDESMTIVVEQQRYYASDTVTSRDASEETVWWIPLTIVTDQIPANNPIKHIFNDKKSTFTFPYKKSEASFWKLNANFAGLYHVHMSEDSTQNIIKLISSGKCNISTEDKMHLLYGALSLAKSGNSNFSLVFDILVAFKNESNYYILKDMADVIIYLSKAFCRDLTVVNGMKEFASYIFKDMLDKFGYKKLPGESELDSLKRKVVISILSFACYEPVSKYLAEEFDKLSSGDADTLDSNLREIAYISVLKHSTKPKESFDSLVNIYKSEQAPDHKIHALNAFGAVNDTSVVKKLLNELIFDENFVRQQDMVYIIKSIVTYNPSPAETRPLVCEFLKREWSRLVKLFESSPIILGRMVSLSFCNDSGAEAVKIFKDWISGDDIKNSSNFEAAYEERKKGLKLIYMQINQAIEILEVRSRWIEKRGCQVRDWLKKSGYIRQ